MAEFLTDHSETVEYGNSTGFMQASKKRVVENGEERTFYALEDCFLANADDDDKETKEVVDNRLSLGGSEEAIDAAIEALQKLKEEL